MSAEYLEGSGRKRVPHSESLPGEYGLSVRGRADRKELRVGRVWECKLNNIRLQIKYSHRKYLYKYFILNI